MKDLVDVPDEVRKQLTIVGVDHMDQVLSGALLDQARPAAQTALRAITPLVRKPSRRGRKAPKGQKAPIAATPVPPVKPIKQPPAAPPTGSA
jgi:hypothetical protein